MKRKRTNEAPDPWIIDRIRRDREEREETDRRAPLHVPVPEWRPDRDRDPVTGYGEDDVGRGIVDIDFTLESLVRELVRETVKQVADVRKEIELPHGLTLDRLREIFRTVDYEAQQVTKKFRELGFRVKWSRWNDRDGDKLAGEAFTDDGTRYFFEFHDVDPRVGRDTPLLVMFDNSGSSGWDLEKKT